MARTAEEAEELQQQLAVMGRELAEMKLKVAAVDGERATLLDNEIERYLIAEKMEEARCAAAEALELEAAQVHLVAKRLKVRHCEMWRMWRFARRVTLVRDGRALTMYCIVSPSPPHKPFPPTASTESSGADGRWVLECNCAFWMFHAVAGRCVLRT